MLRRRSTRPDPTDASAYSRRAAISDSLWAAQDRLRDRLEQAGFAFQDRLVWPVGDRLATMGTPARALSTATLVLLAAAAGVAGLLWASSPDGSQTAATRVAARSAPLVPPRAIAEQPAEPTLQGAAPVFTPAAPDAEVDGAKAIAKSGATGDQPTASNASASESPASGQDSPATASSSARKASVDGPPAGPAAIAVARDFAVAFVSYETGDSDQAVRTAFGETATPALAKALLRRPPRLPANVEVPRAKVVNIVAARSHGDVYPVSVSLLRVGLTSELRLEMEERKGGGWRVTNVLG